MNGHITRMNPVAEKMTGWQEADAAGLPLADIFCILNSQTREPAANPVERVLREGSVVGLSNQTTLIAKDGAEYQIADSGAPLRNVDGHIIGVVLVFRDVTEQLRTEQELLKVKKLESVGLLAGGIAHDFNNLLAGVFGNLEMAKLYLSPDHNSYEFLEAAGQAMENARSLTQQLLTFAKGGAPLKEPLAVGKMLIETAQFSMRGSKARLQADIAPDLWLVEADKGQLSQVISNLVINAQQAMPIGGIVTLTAENVETLEARYVKISVQDEGVGIAPQYLDKIFDPYFTTRQSSSGLGLTIAYSIISKHNGRITVDSHLNQGTLFTIYLPALAETAEKTAENRPAVSAPLVSAGRILVMDDDNSVRKLLEAILKRMGHTVSLAVDGPEAIAKYKAAWKSERPYHAAILDLTIQGGIGGQVVAREILALDPAAKLVVSSGYANDPVMANCKDYGFKARVVKPYLVEDMENIIHQVLAL